jgi:hypothetical protein
MDREPLPLRFAYWAVEHGWTERSLLRFLEQNGISEAEIRQRWPDGVRGAGHELNAITDAEMIAAFAAETSPTLSSLIMFRFTHNAHLKASVRALAYSDIWHPIDVTRRTWRTARAMQVLRKRTSSIECAIVLLIYTWSVAVWLVDDTEDIRRTERTVLLLTRIIGQI